MNNAANSTRFRVWKLMEFSGILHGKKRRALIEELSKKEAAGELDPDERRIWNAQVLHPNDRQSRRKCLKQELKAWEKRANNYTN